MSHYNKKVGKNIPKSEAEMLMDNWSKKKIVTKSNFFGSDILKKLLDKPNAIGIRINYGMDNEGNMAPVLETEFEESSATALASTEAVKDKEYVNASTPCPPYCTTK